MSELCTLGGEVEERRLLPPVGQLDVGVAQLVEEGVRAGLQRGETGRGRVLQQAGAQGDGLRGRARSEYLRRGQGARGGRSRRQLTGIEFCCFKSNLRSLHCDLSHREL